MKPATLTHLIPVIAALAAIIKRVTEELRPKYGQMYGYDPSMLYNVELAIRLVGSYY